MRKQLRFVAFGDSLTVGFQSQTSDSFLPQTTPYTDFLKQEVETMLAELGRAEAFRVQFHNRGVCGELTSDMLLRFKQDVVYLKPSHVVILGGSNDIGWDVVAEEVFSNLKEMYWEAEENGIEPIACTVPSILGFDMYIQPRMELSRLIMKYCHDRGVRCVDLFKATSNPKTNRLLEEYSNDGLHLSTRGYRKVAETIWSEAVEEIIAASLKE